MTLALLKAFLIGGMICAIVQIFIDKTKLMPGRIMVGLVVIGTILGFFGIYQPFIDFAGAGASVPLIAFGNTLMKGVKEAKQVNAKQNVTLYNINKNGTYTFQNSDEAKEDDIIKGKYKVKKGVIIFTPSGKDSEDILLYTKDDHLCEDADCTKIYFKSDESCNAK